MATTSKPSAASVAKTFGVSNAQASKALSLANSSSSGGSSAPAQTTQKTSSADLARIFGVPESQASKALSIMGGDTTSTIAPTDMTDKKVAPFPTMDDSKFNMNSILSGIQAGTATLADRNQFETNLVSDTNTQISDLFANLAGQQPNTAQIYKDALAESGKIEAQKLVNERQAQLNQIVSQGQANQLSVVGQGRGIPEAIIGGQQAQFARETAIQALPVSAQLAAAQGNLEMATENLNTLFKIRSEDATNRFNFQMKVVDYAVQFATKEQDRKIAAVKEAYAEKHAEKQALIARQNNLADMAIKNNQSSLAGRLAALDPNSKTYSTDLQKLTGQLNDPVQELDMAIKRQQLIKATNDNIPSGTSSGQLRQLDDTEYSKFTTNTNYKTIQDGARFERALSDYRDAIETYGTGEIFSAKGKGELNSTYQSLVATVKDYYTLGTLDAGVEKLVGLGLPKPDKIRIRDKKVLSSVDTQLGQVQKTMDVSSQQLLNSVYKDTVELASLLNESGLNKIKAKEPGSPEAQQAADDYIINDVGNALQTNGGMYGSYE